VGGGLGGGCGGGGGVLWGGGGGGGGGVDLGNSSSSKCERKKKKAQKYAGEGITKSFPIINTSRHHEKRKSGKKLAWVLMHIPST